MTAVDPRIGRVEAALTVACETALARGAVLIRGAFEATLPSAPWEAPGVGVSAFGAVHRFGVDSPSVALIAIEVEAVDIGWDGEVSWLHKHEAVRPWWELGARLAARFAPVPVSSLEAR